MPTSRFHSKWFERAFNGSQPLDLDGAGAATIMLGIVSDSVIDPDTTQLYTALTPVAAGTGWTGPVALTGVTAALVSGDWVFDASDPAQIAQDASTGFSNARTVVIYEDTTKYILYTHTEDSAFGNTGGPLTLNFSASGILKVTI